jgi:hypothetical protein
MTVHPLSLVPAATFCGSLHLRTIESNKPFSGRFCDFIAVQYSVTCFAG